MTGKVRESMGLQTIWPKSSTPHLGLELSILNGIRIENRGIPRAIERSWQAAETGSRS